MMRKTTLAMSISGLIAITQLGGAYAAPLTPLSVAAQPIEQTRLAQGNITEVRWHGGWGIGAGLLAGALIGSAFAAPYYYDSYPGYYGYGYPYGVAGYYPSYAYTPYWGGYGWAPMRGPAYGWYSPQPRGYVVRRHWRNSYGWQPGHRWHHRHGVIRTHHWRR